MVKAMALSPCLAVASGAGAAHLRALGVKCSTRRDGVVVNVDTMGGGQARPLNDLIRDSPDEFWIGVDIVLFDIVPARDHEVALVVALREPQTAISVRMSRPASR